MACSPGQGVRYITKQLTSITVKWLRNFVAPSIVDVQYAVIKCISYVFFESHTNIYPGRRLK
jgi:hypothetical protein